MPIERDIYYYLYEGSEEGHKPPVVLIHGAGGTHLYWPPEVRRLPGYRIYALDLPGHGKSGGRGQQSIQAYASKVLAWLEGIGLHSAVFVGHSMGSAIAMSLALDYPEHVLALGLVGASARLRVNPQLLDSAANPTTFYSAVETIIKWSFSPQSPEQLTTLATRRMAEIRHSVLHSDFVACDAFDETGRIAEINQPTLVISGQDDKMTPVRHAQFLADAIPNAKLEVIPDTGHMVMLEKPSSVVTALINFLNGIAY